MSADRQVKPFDMGAGCFLIAVICVVVTAIAVGLIVQGSMEFRPREPERIERVQ